VRRSFCPGLGPLHAITSTGEDGSNLKPSPDLRLLFDVLHAKRTRTRTDFPID
jgi:hypothetical protein